MRVSMEGAEARAGLCQRRCPAFGGMKSIRMGPSFDVHGFPLHDQTIGNGTASSAGSSTNLNDPVTSEVVYSHLKAYLAHSPVRFFRYLNSRRRFMNHPLQDPSSWSDALAEYGGNRPCETSGRVLPLFCSIAHAYHDLLADTQHVVSSALLHAAAIGDTDFLRKLSEHVPAVDSNGKDVLDVNAADTNHRR